MLSVYVILSVHPSVMTRADSSPGEMFLPHYNVETLVRCVQISCHWVSDLPSNKSIEDGPPKNCSEWTDKVAKEGSGQNQPEADIDMGSAF